MRWLELSCRVDSEAVEAVSECFSRVAHGGVAIEPELEPGADDGYSVGSEATVRAYIPFDEQSSPKTQSLDVTLGHLHAIWPIGELLVAEIAEEDWANAWKDHYTTVRIGQHIVIRPSWIAYDPQPDDVVISLDPGAAFGTGLHPTTSRCLQLLENLLRTGDRVLDVGTGSGVLSIAAVALGAGYATALDIDDVAVSVATGNVAFNGFEDRIVVATGSVETPDSTEKFDVVVANIIARVIVELAPRLIDRVAPRGTLIAAGIITDRAADVAARLGDLGMCVERHVDGDWVSFVARRPSDR
jgi:ribosomal protein L11 methyltransferase